MRLAGVKSVYYTISGRGLVKVLLGRGKEVKVPEGSAKATKVDLESRKDRSTVRLTPGITALGLLSCTGSLAVVHWLSFFFFNKGCWKIRIKGQLRYFER
jgi:hypothetical protein